MFEFSTSGEAFDKTLPIAREGYADELPVFANKILDNEDIRLNYMGFGSGTNEYVDKGGFILASNVKIEFRDNGVYFKILDVSIPFAHMPSQGIFGNEIGFSLKVGYRLSIPKLEFIPREQEPEEEEVE